MRVQRLCFSTGKGSTCNAVWCVLAASATQFFRFLPLGKSLRLFQHLKMKCSCLKTASSWGISRAKSTFITLRWFGFAHIYEQVSNVSTGDAIRDIMGLNGVRGNKQVCRPLLELEVFRKQIYCIEEGICDILGTFWRPQNNSAPGELFPLVPPSLRPWTQSNQSAKGFHRKWIHVTVRIVNAEIFNKSWWCVSTNLAK